MCDRGESVIEECVIAEGANLPRRIDHERVRDEPLAELGEPTATHDRRRE